MKKNLLIVISVIIFLIIILLIAVNVIKEEPVNNTENIDGNVTNTIDEQVEKTAISPVEKYTIRSCIYKYINLANKNNSIYFETDENGNYTKTTSDEEIKGNIYTLLSQSYIQANNITVDNLYNYIDDINKNALFDIASIKYYNNENSNQYVVYGIIQDIQNNFIKDAYYIVNMDEANNVFSIEPLLNNKTPIEQIKVVDTKIEKNNNNNIPIVNMTKEDISREYLNTYKRLMLAKPELAYQYLDKEYRQSKFQTLDNFKKYINENKTEIKSARLEKYAINEGEDYTQYTIEDQYENYYIFNESLTMEYSVMLDTYTAAFPEFAKKYNNSLENEKVILNIQRVVDATKSKDYKFVYSKLDEEFKEANFRTEADFEKYIKEKYNPEDTISYGAYEKTRDVYIYNIKVKSKENKTTNAKIVMQLKEGADFVMSFSAE